MKYLQGFLLLAIFVAIVLLFNYRPQPIAAQSTRPNILVIMSDDQDVDSLPVMRYLMSYPEGSWVNFTNAFASNSICCPSRATFLTGQYSHTNGILSNHHGDLFNDDNSLAVWLQDAGYRTALIGKYLHSYPLSKPGTKLPGWDSFQNVHGTVDKHTELAVDFITSDSDPFFVWLAYRAPHYPAQPPARYADADVYVPPDRPNFNEADNSDKSKKIRALRPLGGSAISTMRTERLAAQRELLAIDDGVQRLIELLKSSGQLDNTLIIFLSDHGYSWGAHRMIQKHCLYEECSKFPLLIRYPGLTGNREETRLVSNVDLAATIAEYAGVIPRLPQDGRSLLPLITNTATFWDEVVLLEKPTVDQYAIRVPGWKYIEYAKGEKELYDLTADPYELNNIANRPEYAAIQSQLAQQLQGLLSGTPVPVSTPTPTNTPDPSWTDTPTATPTLTPVPTSTPFPPASGQLLLSSSSGGRVNDITFADEDILLYDPGTNGWQLFFDGSNVGLAAADVDGVHRMEDGSLLLSFSGAIKLPGLGKVEGSDIIRFRPTTLGAGTAGVFELYFDGSRVGLSGRAENLDAISVAPDGRLIISTQGNINVLDGDGNKLKGTRSDLFAFSPTGLGAGTAGTWNLYFDGSDVGLTTSGENISGLWIDAAADNLYLTTSGKFKVNELSGTKADIFRCAAHFLGSGTNCTFAPYWAGASFGVAKEQIDAFTIILEEPVPTVTPTSEPSPTATDTPTATPTDEPSPTATDTPTAMPTDEPSPTATDTPTATPTDEPSPTATDTPTVTPTDEPSPTAEPTETPTP